jgi:TctA family transporter
MIGIWVRLLKVPYQYLYPMIIMLICIGVYSTNNSLFDVFIALVFGVVGYVMRLLDYEPAPLLIGFVLGPMMEENFRRAMVLSRGSYATFVQSPVSATLLAISVALLAWATWAAIRKRRAGMVPRMMDAD